VGNRSDAGLLQHPISPRRCSEDNATYVAVVMLINILNDATNNTCINRSMGNHVQYIARLLLFIIRESLAARVVVFVGKAMPSGMTRFSNRRP